MNTYIAQIQNPEYVMLVHEFKVKAKSKSEATRLALIEAKERAYNEDVRYKLNSITLDK